MTSSYNFLINIYVFVNHRNVGTWSDRGCHVVEDKKKDRGVRLQSLDKLRHFDASQNI